MCMVSNMGDTFVRSWPVTQPNIYPSFPSIYPDGPTRLEFEALKGEIAAFKDLLTAAKKYDEATGQPDCEMGDKVALIKKVAEVVGVDLSEVFK